MRGERIRASQGQNIYAPEQIYTPLGVVVPILHDPCRIPSSAQSLKGEGRGADYLALHPLVELAHPFYIGFAVLHDGIELAGLVGVPHL